MDALIVTLFVSMLLVVGAVVLLIAGARSGDFEHGDRLSLLPLEEDERSAPAGKRHGKTEADPPGFDQGRKTNAVGTSANSAHRL